MHLLKHLKVVVACMILGACTQEYTAHLTKTSLSNIGLADKHRVQRQHQWVMHPGTAIYLIGPTDQYLDGDAVRHMTELYSALDKHLRQIFPSYHTSFTSVSLVLALAQAREVGSELLFMPVLFDAQDHLNTRRELIEGPGVHIDRAYGFDRVLFQIKIYEVRTGKLMDAVTVSSRSHMLAGSESLPQDLFDQAAEQAVKAISSAESS